jgi:hypothetical protein
MTGHAKCASSLYNWGFHSSNDDCSALLLWSQCGFSTSSAERIQFEKTPFFPLRFTSFGVHGVQIPFLHTFLPFVLRKSYFLFGSLFIIHLPRTWNLVAAWQVILCGLIGIPPSNGVIPQSPMHTRCLATLKHQVGKETTTLSALFCCWIQSLPTSGPASLLLMLRPWGC